MKYFYEFHINGLKMTELGRNKVPHQSTDMRHITTFRSTKVLM